ncbi:hypothetical protein EYF80_064455 [Liparis tanakae]|uniref:Uncharacterized protein n=1 Tax=Liparis tanakae TaxID=230148 RepID=A0A4Z2E9A0_9TELE|nr:hypothetical protein EYF80_064455 [Liparis tanakae]
MNSVVERGETEEREDGGGKGSKKKEGKEERVGKKEGRGEYRGELAYCCISALTEGNDPSERPSGGVGIAVHTAPEIKDVRADETANLRDPGLFSAR